MSTKAKISLKVSKDIDISLLVAQRVVEFFLVTIKKTSKSSAIKITGFGTFMLQETPERVGRNPKTKESYIIPKRNKLKFKASSKVKETLN
tara:strand:+ start:84 stop:356 length:273 start_codon:yes stop_codon:yes gene_type:complete